MSQTVNVITRGYPLVNVYSLRTGKIHHFIAGQIHYFYGKSQFFMGKSTISMERSTIFHGNIHYFYGHFPSLFVNVYQAAGSSQVTGRWSQQGPTTFFSDGPVPTKPWVFWLGISHSDCNWDHWFMFFFIGSGNFTLRLSLGPLMQLGCLYNRVMGWNPQKHRVNTTWSMHWFQGSTGRHVFLSSLNSWIFGECLEWKLT